MEAMQFPADPFRMFGEQWWPGSIVISVNDKDAFFSPSFSSSSLLLSLSLSLSPPLPSPPQSKREGRSPASDCRVSPSVVASNLADDRRGHPTGARACAAESTLAATLGWAAVILASRVYIPCYATRLPICPSPTLRWEAPPPPPIFRLAIPSDRWDEERERERGRVCERARVLGDGVASPRQPCVRSDSLPPRVSLSGVYQLFLFSFLYHPSFAFETEKDVLSQGSSNQRD